MSALRIPLLGLGVFVLVVLNIGPPRTTSADPTLVGSWPFTEGAGTTTADASGNGNSGTLVSGPAWTVALSGSALQFSASSYVEVSDSPTLDVGAGDFTLAAWVQRSGVPAPTGTATIISKTTLGAAPGYFLGISNDGHLNFQLIRADGAVGGGISTTTASAGGWHHVAATAQRTGSATLFIDGVVSGNADISAYTGDISNARPLRIGRSETYANQFDGVIDEAKVFNRALTPGEIADLAKDPTLGSYWPFSEGAGATTADTSGNGNHGTLINGPTWFPSRSGQD